MSGSGEIIGKLSNEHNDNNTHPMRSSDEQLRLEHVIDVCVKRCCAFDDT